MATQRDSGRDDPGATDALLEEILVDAYGEAEQLWALRQAFEDNVVLPADAFVIGEPVSVVEIDFDGNERRGLTATCRREDASEHVSAVADLRFPPGSEAARHLAAYRSWLGLEPLPEAKPATSRPHKAASNSDRLPPAIGRRAPASGLPQPGRP